MSLVDTVLGAAGVIGQELVPCADGHRVAVRATTLRPPARAPRERLASMAAEVPAAVGTRLAELVTPVLNGLAGLSNSNIAAGNDLTNPWTQQFAADDPACAGFPGRSPNLLGQCHHCGPGWRTPLSTAPA